MFPPGALVFARAQFAATLPDQADVILVTRTDDASGGSNLSESVIGTYNARAYQDRKGTEPVRGDRRVAVGEWKVAMPWDSTVPLGQTVALRVYAGRVEAGRGTLLGVFSVHGTNAGESERATLICDCERIGGG